MLQNALKERPEFMLKDQVCVIAISYCPLYVTVFFSFMVECEVWDINLYILLRRTKVKKHLWYNSKDPCPLRIEAVSHSDLDSDFLSKPLCKSHLVKYKLYLP